MARSIIGKLSACLVLVMLVGAALAASGDRELPSPTGKLAVGRTTFFWTDDSRPEPWTEDQADHRQPRVDLWYPAQKTADATAAPYWPDLKALGKQMGAEAFLLGVIKGHTLAAPPIVAGDARYPVVIVSPGYGNAAVQYTGLVEELVSHGYVVATVDHPFQSRAIVYPDGRIVTVVPSNPSPSADPQAVAQDYRTRIEAIAGDLRFVLDQLTRLNSGDPKTQFAGRLDLDHAAIVGHSIGGVAATRAALDDARFKGAVNFDGHQQSLPLWLDDQGHAQRQPFMELTDGQASVTDQNLAKWKISRAEFDEQRAASTKRVDAVMNQITGGSYRVTTPGIRHGSFGDMAIWDPDSLEVRHRRFQIVRDYTRAFLDKVLRGEASTLLDSRAAEPYAEVKVERFGSAR